MSLEGENEPYPQDEQIQPEEPKYFPPIRRNRPLIGRFLGRTIPVVYVGAIAFLFYEAFDKMGAFYGIEQWLNDRFNPPPTEIALPKDKEGNRIEYFDSGILDTVQKSVESFKAWQDYSQLYLQPLLQKRQPSEVINTFEQMQRGSLVGGVNILQTAWLIKQSDDEVVISPDLTYLWINHQPYNLQNRFHSQIANNWVFTKLQYLDKKLKLSLNKVREEDIALNSYQRDTFEEEAHLLEWLRVQNPQIVLQEGSYAFFPQYEMVNIARVFNSVVEHGYSLPNKIEWCGSRCLGKYGAEGLARPALNMAELNNESSPKTVAHEVAHLLSVTEGLVFRFAAIRGAIGQDSEENMFRYVSTYAMTNFFEDFAETFAEYVMFGEQLRLKLEELRPHKPEDYPVLKKKYDFMKTEVFHGTEFTSFAKALNPDQDKKEQEFPGIRWLSDNKELEIRPNPDAFSGQRYWIKAIPVFIEDHFETIQVIFEYSPTLDSYEVQIQNGKLLSTIILHPLGEDEQASVENTYSGLKPRFVSGKAEVNLSQVGGDYASLRVNSLSRVGVGQHRKSRFGATFIDDFFNPDSRLSFIFDIYDLVIEEGPQERRDPETGELKRYWKVDATKTSFPDKGKKIAGWIEELGIGKKVSANSH